jgi:Nuclease-related domain
VISYPRQQLLRRSGRAVTAAVGAIVVSVLALMAAERGAVSLAGILLIVTAALAAYARHWTRLAGRSRVGASSERQVRDALELLRADGWRVRHSLSRHGGGDIDHVAIAPRDVGLAFAIETKTKTYRAEHVAHAAATAGWLASRRRRWCPRGALGVLCIVRSRGVERVENDVLVVSIDRLPGALRTAAGAQARPAFLAPAPPSPA